MSRRGVPAQFVFRVIVSDGQTGIAHAFHQVLEIALPCRQQPSRFLRPAQRTFGGRAALKAIHVDPQRSFLVIGFARPDVQHRSRAVAVPGGKTASEQRNGFDEISIQQRNRSHVGQLLVLVKRVLQ